MNAIDLTPIYRNSIGFDRLASLLDKAVANDHVSPSYPPYDIEVLADNQYAITLAVAGFEKSEISLSVENGVLTVKGEKTQEEEKNYLHHGIAFRAFERKFNLADYVEVTGASLEKGLLKISLVKEIPEAMKPREIPIGESVSALEHQVDTDSAAKAAH
jgi:molecular chaperone IbpA